MTPQGLLVAAALLALAVLAGCDRPQGPGPYRFTRFAMGTVVEYTIHAPDHGAALEAMLAAHEEVERVERLLWEESPESPLHHFNASPDGVALDGEVRAFLSRVSMYHRRTGGAFDVTVKPVLELYDFDAETPVPPAPDDVEARQRLVGMRHLTTGGDTLKKAHPGVRLAVGGVAKGYAVDRAVAVLREHGIRDALVNAGGDMYCLGTNAGQPWAVGIRHPDDPERIVRVLHVADRAVATSGDYQRFFVHGGKRYHHLLDPKTGRPARALRSATVTASTAEEADALATALFVHGREVGLQFIERMPDAEGFVVEPGGTVASSRGLD